MNQFYFCIGEENKYVTINLLSRTALNLLWVKNSCSINVVKLNLDVAQGQKYGGAQWDSNSLTMVCESSLLTITILLHIIDICSIQIKSSAIKPMEKHKTVSTSKSYWTQGQMKLLLWFDGFKTILKVRKEWVRNA